MRRRWTYYPLQHKRIMCDKTKQKNTHTHHTHRTTTSQQYKSRETNKEHVFLLKMEEEGGGDKQNIYKNDKHFVCEKNQPPQEIHPCHPAKKTRVTDMYAISCPSSTIIIPQWENRFAGNGRGPQELCEIDQNSTATHSGDLRLTSRNTCLKYYVQILGNGVRYGCQGNLWGALRSTQPVQERKEEPPPPLPPVAEGSVSWPTSADGETKKKLASIIFAVLSHNAKYVIYTEEWNAKKRRKKRYHFAIVLCTRAFLALLTKPATVSLGNFFCMIPTTAPGSAPLGSVRVSNCTAVLPPLREVSSQLVWCTIARTVELVLGRAGWSVE